MSVILVTGGAGYIGSHACKALAVAGHHPVVYDNLSTGHADAVRWGPLEVGDIRDGGRLDAAFAQWRPDAVMHFAALAQVAESAARPELYYETNVGGTLCLTEAMRRAGCDALVFSSTCAIFGNPDAPAIHEDLPFGPINCYGRSKAMVEQMLRDLEAAHGMRSVCLRYFNAAGHDPEGELRERHEPETHAVPLALRVAAGRLPHFSIFGTDYDTPDGTPVRDYVHVSDLAEAHLLALERLLGGGASRQYNLGRGNGTSVRELVTAVERVTGRRLPVVVAPRRPGDPARLVADPSRAQRELGWLPAFTSITDIVATAWATEREAREPVPLAAQ